MTFMKCNRKQAEWVHVSEAHIWYTEGSPYMSIHASVYLTSSPTDQVIA